MLVEFLGLEPVARHEDGVLGSQLPGWEEALEHNSAPLFHRDKALAPYSIDATKGPLLENPPSHLPGD